MSQHLSPDLARQILNEANDLGVTVEEYLRLIINQRNLQPGIPEVSLPELDGLFDNLAVPGLRTLPEDFSRADIYRDHD
jgi:hypothetical protein